MKTIPDYNAPRAFFSPLTLCFAVGLIAILAQLAWGPAHLQTLDSIESFFIRSMATQFVHLGGVHLGLNLAALFVLAWGFGGLFTPQHWLYAFVGGLGWVAFYVSWLEPLAWYCGLSGAMHMHFVVGLGLAFARSQDRGLKAWPLWLMVAGLAAKLTIEWASNAATDPMLGGPVAIEAHRGGVTGGLLWLAGLWTLRRSWRAAA
ncbi:MAG TPA: hypothetical protein VFV39_08110 [Limnobacter sp.]|nr:hypothetical protein [Limnobacter sp.]